MTLRHITKLPPMIAHRIHIPTPCTYYCYKIQTGV